MSFYIVIVWHWSSLSKQGYISLVLACAWKQSGVEFLGPISIYNVIRTKEIVRSLTSTSHAPHYSKFFNLYSGVCLYLSWVGLVQNALSIDRLHCWKSGPSSRNSTRPFCLVRGCDLGPRLKRYVTSYLGNILYKRYNHTSFLQYN